MIKLKEITKKYILGKIELEALRGINLTINSGEFLSIMGHSGSGKSTMMSILGCLDSPTSGEYYLDNEDVSKLSENYLADIRNKKIGFVFQTFNLMSNLTAFQNAQLPLLYGKYHDSKKAPEEALEIVGLKHRKNHKPSELSGGERQRVAIARAIVTKPSIIMADEPTGNLDTNTGNQIMDIFTELHKNGATIILVTHEPDIAKYSKRIVVLKDGQIVNDEKN
ncbi:ABC transporter ATP-binding protein [Candidatus Dependentiae bacterium]|nr:ABC transporter ATP-binding protein [Candidatus Dependentiae bacterium]